jgi:hypothetical protein
MFSQRRFREGLEGNFTAYVPRQLTIFDLRLAAAPPEAIGFPSKITYSGSRPGLTTETARVFVAEYRPRFETFIHSGSCRKLSYSWAGGGTFHVDVLHNRQSGEWNIYKFRAGQLLSRVCGQGYGEAVIHASGIGLEGTEPAFTFAGDPDECRRENLAQAEWAGEGSGEEGVGEAGEERGAPTLAFGVVRSALGGSNLVFVPREKASELAAIALALRARTWGEFKLRMPPQRLPELLRTFLECGAWASFDRYYLAHAESGTRAERERLWDCYQKLPPGERMPLDDDGFEPSAVPGAGEGNWPERPEQAMLRWLPPLICGRLGRRVFSRRRGDYLVFDPGRSPEIVAALEQAGFRCCWEEELVRAACRELDA